MNKIKKLIALASVMMLCTSQVQGQPICNEEECAPCCEEPQALCDGEEASYSSYLAIGGVIVGAAIIIATTNHHHHHHSSSGVRRSSSSSSSHHVHSSSSCF